MSTEIIGIAGVFVVTSLLLVLLHCFLSFPPGDKHRTNSSAPDASKISSGGMRANDSWPLWNAELRQDNSSTRVYESTAVARNAIEKGALRYDGRQPSTL